MESCQYMTLLEIEGAKKTERMKSKWGWDAVLVKRFQRELPVIVQKMIWLYNRQSA